MKNIEWVDKQNCRAEASDVVRYIENVAKDSPEAMVKVHVSPRTMPIEPLEWYMTFTSPQGRQTLTVIQRKPFGAVIFKPGI